MVSHHVLWSNYKLNIMILTFHNYIITNHLATGDVFRYSGWSTISNKFYLLSHISISRIRELPNSQFILYEDTASDYGYHISTLDGFTSEKNN